MKQTNSGEIFIVINNENGNILPSETFLTAHINQLPGTIVPLVGIPTGRILIHENRKRFLSKSFIPLGIRWLIRQLGWSTIEKQDRHSLAKFLRSRNVVAVVAEYGPTAVSVMDACKDASVPLIAHFHGFDAYTHDVMSKYQNKYVELFKQAAAVIAVSEDMKKQLISIGSDENKTFVNACGADVPEGLIATPKDSAINFVMVGRLVEKKAPFISLIAFSEVVKSYPDAKLDIIGDGFLLNSCKQLADGLGISKQVVFHGPQPHSKVFDVMKNARCFIQHSVITPDNDHEGTPVGVLEAMGMGLVVISTKHGGINDVIENGITGSLVDEFDMEAMTKSMLYYAENPDKAQKIGESARLEIMNNRTSKKSVDRLWSIISQAIK